MKRFNKLLGITMLSFAVAAIGMIGCEGPAGPAGADGTNGTDGMDGADMDASCKVCHNETSDLLAKQIQAANSGHMMNHNFARSSASCAGCHTHEGFIERMVAGTPSASTDVEDPTPPNCRTCHKVHESYTEADYALRYIDPVTLEVNGVTVDYGNGNTCANCHQPRPISPYPVAGGDSVTITSSRWGPHHGPQAGVVWGTSAYEIAGDENYGTAGTHKHAEAGCVTCHMVAVEDYGNYRGGHTFSMTFDDHGDEAANTDACVGCHSSIGDDFDYNGKATLVTELHDSLGAILLAKEWIDEGGYIDSRPLTLAPDDAGALLNWRYVLEDNSTGIHNPAYVVALLKNSIAHLSK